MESFRRAYSPVKKAISGGAHDGDKERVAEILGISTRSLYRKLEASED
ncbi:MAG TPA: hypothetical protein DIC58_13980 [Gammaproteobacteria bacterium]|nr:hypothetical protein [Gammaproteobacteria bacterium]